MKRIVLFLFVILGRCRGLVFWRRKNTVTCHRKNQAVTDTGEKEKWGEGEELAI